MIYRDFQGKRISALGFGTMRLPLARKDELRGAIAADKVAGKAAAFLYVLLGVSAVRTRLSSLPAREVFARHGVAHK